jgi:hypothetical protein
MSGVLDEVLAAHGGLDRWRAAGTISALGRFGGVLRSRMPGNRMASVALQMDLAEQRIAFDGFPTSGQRAIFDAGDVRVESRDGEVLRSRHDARAMFSGFSSLRRNVRWDALDATYFAGYAWWNYLSTPLLLTRSGVEVSEGDPWQERGETWRRLEVQFPAGLHTHSAHQTFYVDSAGLIRRHDYTAEPIGRWAHAAHYCDDHETFDGLVFPTRRRVHPIGPGGRALPRPTLVALDIEHITVAPEPAHGGVTPSR